MKTSLLIDANAEGKSRHELSPTSPSGIGSHMFSRTQNGWQRYRELLLCRLELLQRGLKVRSRCYGRLGLPFGRLPGDLSYRGRHVQVFAPLGTSVLLSILISLILYALARFRR